MITIDCGEGRHMVCRGAGDRQYLIPQYEGEFACGCRCHHEGIPADHPDGLIRGVPCIECDQP